MRTARKRGNLDSRERPDSPEWDFSTQKIVCTRTFEGLYQDLLSKVPVIGASMEGFAEDLLVENVKLKKAVSGKTTMTVVLEVDIAAGTNTYPEPVQPVYELEWTQLEKPIEQNPSFSPLFNVPYTGEVINAHYVALDAWENATATSTPTKTDAFTALATADPTGGLTALAMRKMVGETTFLTFNPVARITTLARNTTLSAACGRIYDAVPGFVALPAGFKWLSTADRSTRTGVAGKWQRVQEWTGAEKWDTSSYRNAASGGTNP